jgi:hypothetical protein
MMNVFPSIGSHRWPGGCSAGMAVFLKASPLIIFTQSILVFSGWKPHVESDVQDAHFNIPGWDPIIGHQAFQLTYSSSHPGTDVH